MLREEGRLRVHVEAGLVNGLARTQISEAIMHTAPYVGVPQALRSMSIAREVFDRLDTAAGDPAPPGAERQWAACYIHVIENPSRRHH